MPCCSHQQKITDSATKLSGRSIIGPATRNISKMSRKRNAPDLANVASHKVSTSFATKAHTEALAGHKSADIKVIKEKRLIGSLPANILVRKAELLLSSVEPFLSSEQVVSRYTNPLPPS